MCTSTVCSSQLEAVEHKAARLAWTHQLSGQVPVRTVRCPMQLTSCTGDAVATVDHHAVHALRVQSAPPLRPRPACGQQLSEQGTPRAGADPRRTSALAGPGTRLDDDMWPPRVTPTITRHQLALEVALRTACSAPLRWPWPQAHRQSALTARDSRQLQLQVRRATAHPASKVVATCRGSRGEHSQTRCGRRRRPEAPPAQSFCRAHAAAPAEQPPQACGCMR